MIESGNKAVSLTKKTSGVSEGQYKTVLEQEFTQILGACRNIYQKHKAPRPLINVIVVGKRHHTRFYPTEEKYADMASRVKGNPPNGTVVDRGVTMEKGHDFYLQAHVALQGTVSTSFSPQRQKLNMLPGETGSLRGVGR